MRHLKDNYWNDKQYDYTGSGNSQDKSELIIKDNTIVYFVDDIFTIKKPRVKQILNGMIEENLNMLEV